MSQPVNRTFPTGKVLYLVHKLTHAPTPGDGIIFGEELTVRTHVAVRILGVSVGRAPTAEERAEWEEPASPAVVAPPPATSPVVSGETAVGATQDQIWCETCNGSGKVYQEHQAGFWAAGDHPCPDCDGKGWWAKSVPASPDQAGEIEKLRQEYDAKLSERTKRIYDIVYRGDPDENRDCRWKWVIIGAEYMKNENERLRQELTAMTKRAEEGEKWSKFHDLQAQRIMIQRDAAIARAEEAKRELEAVIALNKRFAAEITDIEAQRDRLAESLRGLDTVIGGVEIHGISLKGEDKAKAVVWAKRRAQDALAAIDQCAQMRAMCMNCGGTGEMHRGDGEYMGRCGCRYGAAIDGSRGNQVKFCQVKTGGKHE